MRDRSRAAAREFELLRSSQHPEQPPRLARRSARRTLRRKPPKKCSAAKYRCCTVPRPLPGPPGGTAPARAPGGAGFKGQHPLRTGNLHRTPWPLESFARLPSVKGLAPVRCRMNCGFGYLSMAPGVTHRFRCSRVPSCPLSRVICGGCCWLNVRLVSKMRVAQRATS